MEATTEKRGRGRPKKPESERRREVRTFVAPEDADRLAEIGARHDVSPGAVLALLWRLAGEELMHPKSGVLQKALREHIMPSVAALMVSRADLDEAVNTGKVRLVLVDGVSMVDGESFRAWFLRR